jgi:thioredoxin 1
MTRSYEAELPRADVEALTGAAVIEFGTPWCGYCQAAQPLIATGLADRPGVQHLKFEDGKGRPLGRSFQVKLWPTLIFMRDGKEIARVVRPTSAVQISDAASQIA